MSADLFAAFGDEPSQQQNTSSKQRLPASQAAPTPAPAFSFFDDLTSAAPAPKAQVQQPTFQFGNTATSTNNDNDDWGDFEGTSSFEPAPVKHDPAPSFQPQYQVPQTSWQQPPAAKPKKAADPNVLFDAEDDPGDDEEDDFGDFEGTESQPAPVARPGGSTGLEDLLGDMNVSQTKPPATSSPRRDFDTGFRSTTSPSPLNPVGGFGTMARPKQTPTTTVAPAAKQEDSWDTFDDWEASIPSKAPTKAAKAPQEAAKSQTPVAPPAITSPTFDDVQPGESPPTNVPPPGILLSLFPPLFAEAQNKLFKPIAAQPLPMRNQLLAEPATVSYLQAYLELASVAGRIIAGRKLRWKRDQHLSQGMRIGPASSRATSGMKLTGIDKSENLKEEREVADVVRAWKEQIGKLRHVVSAINQIKAGTLGRGPDLQETMPVKTLKQAEGGVPAPQPCMMCGLKRDERVGASDQQVEDSFGEWWVDQVSMHRGCRNFWNEHKDDLRQR